MNVIPQPWYTLNPLYIYISLVNFPKYCLHYRTLYHLYRHKSCNAKLFIVRTKPQILNRALYCGGQCYIHIIGTNSNSSQAVRCLKVLDSAFPVFYLVFRQMLKINHSNTFIWLKSLKPLKLYHCWTKGRFIKKQHLRSLLK